MKGNYWMDLVSNSNFSFVQLVPGNGVPSKFGNLAFSILIAN